MKKTICVFLLAALTISMIPFLSSASVVVPVSTEPGPAAVKAALAELKSLPKKERKERIKEAKFQLKQLKKEKKAGHAAKVEEIVLIILAVLLPPLAVYLHQGEINSKFWISILLTLLFWLPGVIYALIVVTGAA